MMVTTYRNNLTFNPFLNFYLIQGHNCSTTTIMTIKLDSQKFTKNSL